ncbi:carbonic anhydrase-like isoform X2 [Ptychodera flava]|uniref:carbonic anhydrase-like isoform X2 n=1 Tax=Ptychodera flava TaxID=63121 RepID=UPI00396A777B
MEPFGGLIGFIALVTAPYCQAVSVEISAVNWGYRQSDGPSTWPTNFPDYCAGSKQSPIDVVEDDAEPKDLGKFTFNGMGDTPPSGASMSLINNGHSVQVNLVGDYSITGAELPNTYTVAQFHFHWGSSNTVGSEHTLNGGKYPIEMHVVSYDSKYPDLGTAAGEADGIAVIGTFIEVGSSNDAYDTLIDALANVTYKDDTYDFPSPFPILPMMSSDLDVFYRYSGSLTTPMCQESVIWSVMKDKVELSSAQIAKFRTVNFNAEGEPDMPMVNNYRPPQPLNNRKVYVNDETAGDSAGIVRPLSALVALSAIITIFSRI